MKMSAFETRLVREDGRQMRFEILVPEGSSVELVLEEGRKYLAARNIGTSPLTAASCRFCRSELANEALARVLARDGAAIFEIEHCD